MARAGLRRSEGRLPISRVGGIRITPQMFFLSPETISAESTRAWTSTTSNLRDTWFVIERTDLSGRGQFIAVSYRLDGWSRGFRRAAQ